jgi:hypothetical protein
MKIIELLNKIANNENVPKKIKFEGLIYSWDKIGYLHYKDDYYRECSLLEGLRVELVLNAEVEIIEDEEEIQSIEKLNPYDTYFRDGTELVYKLMYDKINEIAMKVNKLDKKMNSIEQK